MASDRRAVYGPGPGRLSVPARALRAGGRRQTGARRLAGNAPARLREAIRPRANFAPICCKVHRG